MKFELTNWFMNLGRKVFYLFYSKQGAELRYWRRCFRNGGGRFRNEHYRKLMLGMAQERDEQFLSDKIVADFGCGPRGSLQWAGPALLRIGIDVLAAAYLKHFKTELLRHEMIYLQSTEEIFPLPDNCVDVLFTLNALDHVKHLELMCREIVRIIKPGGLLIGSFNLNSVSTIAEPNPLSEQKLKNLLLDSFEIISCRISGIPEKGYLYEPLLTGNLLELREGKGIMWVRASKKPDS